MDGQVDFKSTHSATPDGLTVSPSLDLVSDGSQVPKQSAQLDRRVVAISGIAIVLGIAAAGVAVLLMALIGFFTNLAFYGRFSLELVSPADAVPRLGLWVIPIPVIGALIIGVMARFGSNAIRGHGIPEAMEQVLTNRSRIPMRVMFLKPLSSAISIGTGGPFGAEGPIIATGGALGSVVGQALRISAAERKTLLAAGAAAGMSATFGSPIAAVLLAVELLLFEYRPRSLIPVALASAVAAGMRVLIEGSEPVFAMPDLPASSMGALGFYLVLGAAMGLVAAAVTRILYGIEDAFDRLPIHWMWWPALGAVVVGVVGYFAPDTLGVGYYNITAILSDELSLTALAFLCSMKFLSWSIALGSGTSGGTLAPLFTIGGGVGAMLGAAGERMLPLIGIDVRVAALVGMATIFAGASRALMASAVFAFETTLQPMALTPLLAGCAAAYLVSTLVMENSIMTEKIARRGIRTPSDYAADPLNQIVVSSIASAPVVTLAANRTVREVRAWMTGGAAGTTHQGFPVLDEDGHLTGVLTRRELLAAQDDEVTLRDLIARLPKFVYDDASVREAADHMVNHDIGRLPVVSRAGAPRVVGMITRSDILSAYRHRMDEDDLEAQTMGFGRWRRG